MRKLLIVLVLFTLGCEKTPSQTTSGSGNARIQDARRVMAQIMSLTGRSQANEMTERILNEPDFSGHLKEWGAIVQFDSAGNIKEVRTLKTVDFSSGNRYNVRAYTEQEIASCRTQILNRRKQLGVPIDMAFPIFSESFKLAVAEAVLNDSSVKTYTIGRGSGLEQDELQVIEFTGISRNVIAADALYQKKN